MRSLSPFSNYSASKRQQPRKTQKASNTTLTHQPSTPSQSSSNTSIRTLNGGASSENKQKFDNSFHHAENLAKDDLTEPEQLSHHSKKEQRDLFKIKPRPPKSTLLPCNTIF